MGTNLTSTKPYQHTHPFTPHQSHPVSSAGFIFDGHVHIRLVPNLVEVLVQTIEKKGKKLFGVMLSIPDKLRGVLANHRLQKVRERRLQITEYRKYFRK